MSMSSTCVVTLPTVLVIVRSAHGNRDCLIISMSLLADQGASTPRESLMTVGNKTIRAVVA